MDLFYLNPFVFIAKDAENYFINATGGNIIALTQEQAEKLLDKNEFTREELAGMFSAAELKRLMENKCFLPFRFDMESRDSRTNGYFMELGLLKEYRELRDKHVYLLGAGAMGTHVGWNLCALGVRNFTILDCDEIEESNLNRQVLYTLADVGRKKTEVLKEKLLEINKNCNIDIVNTRVESMNQLRELFKCKPDLVVRGIDTPVDISHWVFSVCEDMDIPYISGGTMGTHSIYGPTYVPGKTAKHTEIKRNGQYVYRESDAAKRLKGTGISTSFAISTVAAETTIEAVKILCGKGELVKYGAKLVETDHFSIDKKEDHEDELKAKKSKWFINAIMIMTAALVGISAVISNGTPIMPIVYVLLATLAFGIWHDDEKEMYINSAVVGAIAGTTNLLAAVFMGRANMLAASPSILMGILSTVPLVIFMITLMICLHAMFFILISGIENSVFKKIKISNSL
ncbi:MAG: ThiF family adenylyltransferase [Lachnospiraceae bacterium]|nr:ThiF family adenylyltransferase [Lachnospiraceae bacterium]